MWSDTAATDARGMTTTVLPPAPPLPPPGTWGRGIWVAVTLGAVVEGFLALVAMIYIKLGAAASCGTEPTMNDVRSGEFFLMVATCVALAPWVIALALRPRRLGLVAIGVLAVSPLIYGMVAGLEPDFWASWFCF